MTDAFTHERIAQLRGLAERLGRVRSAVYTSGGMDEPIADLIDAACSGIPEALDEIEGLSAERDAWKENAIACGKMLQSFTPGGSEYFGKRIGDEHFATDEKACGAVIRSKLDALHKSRCEAVNTARELSRLKAELDEAMGLLTKIGECQSLGEGNEYRGWSITGLNRAVAAARSFLSRMEGR